MMIQTISIYTYDEESYVKVYDFLNEWQLVLQGVERWYWKNLKVIL